jgi:hypothetical protein
MEQHRHILASEAAETVACRERRAAVLKHPDLCQQLLDELGYQRPEQWNGFIPPATFNGAPNDSPRRAALMLISAEAWKREHPALDVTGHLSDRGS